MSLLNSRVDEDGAAGLQAERVDEKRDRQRLLPADRMTGGAFGGAGENRIAAWTCGGFVPALARRGWFGAGDALHVSVLCCCEFLPGLVQKFVRVVVTIPEFGEYLAERGQFDGSGRVAHGPVQMVASCTEPARVIWSSRASALAIMFL